MAWQHATENGIPYILANDAPAHDLAALSESSAYDSSAVMDAFAYAASRWSYVETQTGLMITGYHEPANGILTIPKIIDGHAVTEIARYVFNGAADLTSVILPEWLESIGDGAFQYCVGLTSVTIPDGTTNIGNFAFFHCDSLESVKIPETVTSIGFAVFGECRNLTLDVTPGSAAERYAIENDIPYTCASGV
jgi:hypothetical protein